MKGTGRVHTAGGRGQRRRKGRCVWSARELERSTDSSHHRRQRKGLSHVGKKKDRALPGERGGERERRRERETGTEKEDTVKVKEKRESTRKRREWLSCVCKCVRARVGVAVCRSVFKAARRRGNRVQSCERIRVLFSSSQPALTQQHSKDSQSPLSLYLSLSITFSISPSLLTRSLYRPPFPLLLRLSLFTHFPL